MDELLPMDVVFPYTLLNFMFPKEILNLLLRVMIISYVWIVNL